MMPAITKHETDIVIIGAGVFGSLLAYELSNTTCKGVTLIEANTPGSGLTGESPGIIALLDTDVLNAQQAWFAATYYRQLNKKLPGGIAFKDCKGMLYTSAGIKPFIAAQINTRRLCEKLVTAALVHNIQYLENCKVSSIESATGNKFLVRVTNGEIHAQRVILAMGAHVSQLIPESLARVSINKSFQSNIYAYTTDTVEIYMQEDLYLLPWQQHCVVGFLHRDHKVSNPHAICNEPSTHVEIHKTLCGIHPVFSSYTPLECKVYIDNFSESSQVGFTTDKQTGVQYIFGASGNGITQAPGLVKTNDSNISLNITVNGYLIL